MLNWNNVLKYIKGRVALPSSFIEKNDVEIKEWITIKTIPEFSTYFPDEEYTSVLYANSNYTVPGKTNYYRFFDEEDLDIIGIVECFFPLEMDDWYHPLVEPMNFSEMKWWSLAVFKAKMFAETSSFNKTYKFIGPNMVQILPKATSNFVVQYEREQPHDLRKIPTALKTIFMDLACSDIMMWIGTIRTQYQSVETPFGQIPLNGEQLRSDAEQLRQSTMDKMVENSLPPITIDIG